MKSSNLHLKPQDILLLLKIISNDEAKWQQKKIADSIGLSQSEVSEAVSRCKYAALLAPDGKTVMKLSLMEFLQYGLRYVFPQKPGAIVRGLPTSHAAAPLNELIKSNDQYVWPFAKGTVRGQSIVPLYPSVPQAALNDANLYKLLALVDALRVGRAREKELAVIKLKEIFKIGKQNN